MQVKELIHLLQQHDPEAMVVVDGYEGGLDEPYPPVEVKIRLNINPEDYYGSHERVQNEESDVQGVKAIYLQRSNRRGQ